MTDWKLIAKARGLDLDEQTLSAHAASLSQLDAAMADLKKILPFDGEPSPAFAPVVSKVAGKQEGKN